MVLETEKLTQQNAAPKQAKSMEPPRPTPLALVDELIERLVIWAQARWGTEEFARAKEAFFTQTGKAFPEDAFFEDRLSCFLNDFLFLRRLPGQDTTPYEAYMEAAGQRQETDPLFTGLGGFRFSLFEVLSLKKDKLSVRDLLTKAKHSVAAKDGQSFTGITKGNVFQAFLFPCGEELYLGQGVVFHPASARRTIKAELAKILKEAAKVGESIDEKAFLHRLAWKHMRHMRHLHLEPRKVYSMPVPTAAGSTSKI